MPIVCPICKSVLTTPMLDEHEIHVTGDGKRLKVGADLAAFHCQEWHVFFVLREDLRKQEQAG